MCLSVSLLVSLDLALWWSCLGSNQFILLILSSTCSSTPRCCFWFRFDDLISNIWYESDPSSDPQSGSATKETIISDDPVSPVLPRRSQRQSHPQVKYSPGLLFTNNDEPNTYEKASTCVNSHKHDNNHVKIRTLHLLYIVKSYILTNTSKYMVILSIS